MENEMVKNPLCVISKETSGLNSVHSIQMNSSWEQNPYGDKFAIVPDYMVEDIFATAGFCDIVLNDDGTEVLSFTVREKPKVEIVEEPSQLDMIEAQVTYTAMMTDTLLEV